MNQPQADRLSLQHNIPKKHNLFRLPGEPLEAGFEPLEREFPNAFSSNKHVLRRMYTIFLRDLCARTRCQFWGQKIHVAPESKKVQLCHSSRRPSYGTLPMLSLMYQDSRRKKRRHRTSPPASLST